MPTYAEIVDEIRSNAQSGISADDSRLDDLYLESKLDTTRAAAIAKYINAGGRINSAWVQEVNLDMVDVDKECKLVTFECPTVLFTNGKSDGFVYVGKVNGMKPFIRVNKEIVSLALHSKVQATSDILWDFRVGLQNRSFISCYNNPRLEQIMVRGIFNKPSEVPGFRKDTDMYPIDESLRNEVIQRITEELLRGPLRVQPDYISDGADKPTK